MWKPRPFWPVSLSPPVQFADPGHLLAQAKPARAARAEPWWAVSHTGDYFRTVTQPSSPLLRAYRYIRLAPLERPAFPDNLVAAYAALDSQRGTNGVTGAELQRLLVRTARRMAYIGPILRELQINQ